MIVDLDNIIQAIKQEDEIYQKKISKLIPVICNIAGHLSGMSELVVKDDFDKLRVQGMLTDDSKTLLETVDTIKKLKL